MADFRTVTADFAVSPQIDAADVLEAARLGYVLIVNNRPDGEAAGQPTGAALEAAATAAGLAYVHIPVTGPPSPGERAAMRRAMTSARGKTLAFCRSGTRSITAWAMGQMDAGRLGRDEAVRLASAAGYDLSRIPPPSEA